MKIAIDPGHGFNNKSNGRYDPGAGAGGQAEADIALAWALTLKFVLTEAGFEVFMTRDDETDSAPVGTRDDRARAAGCDLFISIHCNATPGATGVETFYRDAADKRLAAIVQKCALKALGLKDRGLKTEGNSQHSALAVLNFGPPACLLELGFIDNPTDRERMLSRVRRIAFAEALAEALAQF